MSNKSLLGKNAKTETNKNYSNLISNIAFEISNVKTDKTEKLVKSGSRRASNFESQSH
jgi:hypothetical protein